MEPLLPVAGRLTQFLPFWRLVSQDPWVTQVVAQGYQLEFSRIPPETGTRVTRLSADGASAMLEEVSELCAKCAVVPIPPGQRGKGYYSTYFLVTKKDGGLRPILNLKRFNQNLVKRSFKMETLQNLIPIMVPGVWLASIDLKDAYLHVPMAKECWKYLCFAIDGKHYFYVVTPFGLSPAPMLFTRIVRVLVAWLRLRGVRLHAYLDDIILIANSPQEVYRSLQITIQVFTWAGFILNVKKSDLTPTQDLVYIGGRFRTDQGRVFLPEDRRVALQRAILSFARVGMRHPVRLWMQILGLMAATISTVALARLHMREIQWHVKRSWQDLDMSSRVMVTKQVYQALQWWTVPMNLSLGRPFQEPVPTLTVTTDASMMGWGGHSRILGQTYLFSNLWTASERLLHINLLELRGVFLTMCNLQDHLRDKVVKVECDNKTAVSYLNKQGGTRSWPLCEEALRVYAWMQEYNVTVVAVHRPGVNNELADFLSRNRPDPTEWSLSHRACSKLFRHWGTPQVDLFASPMNHKLPTWFSRHSCSAATAVDAFAQSWSGLFVYAFPPINLIRRVLLQIRNQQVEEAIVVVPNWPAREWFPLLLQMTSEIPVQFRLELDLLSQTLQDRETQFHPDLRQLQLTAWKLNGRSGFVPVSLKPSPTLLSRQSSHLLESSTTPVGARMSSGVGIGRSTQFHFL